MVSIVELQQLLNASTDEVAYLADLEAAAVEFAETEMGIYLGPTRQATEYKFPRGALLFLRAAPSGTLTVQRRASATATAEAVAATDYAVRGRTLVRPGGWPWGEYEITYDEGYAPGAQPEGVRSVVRDYVRMAYQARTGVQSETMGGYSYSMADDGSPDGLQGLRDRLHKIRRKLPGVA